MKKLKLKEFREKANMTQADVAAAMNISQSYYSRFELGKALPDAEQIIKLCEIFSCTPNDLFGVAGAMEVAFGPLLKEKE